MIFGHERKDAGLFRKAILALEDVGKVIVIHFDGIARLLN
jgi:hypothetical protein